MSDGGKGSNPRPFSVSQKQFADNYDAIFRKPSPKELEEEKYEQEEFDRVMEENRMRQKREKALDEIVRINQELGLYDDEYNPLIKE
jgi:hypothetical protein